MRLIDSAEETAEDTARMLDELGLAKTTGDAAYRFIASDDPQQFLSLGQRFLGDVIERVEIHSFG
jgi:glutamate racemase